ncbi:MAG: cell division protein FtsA [Rhodospirillales bacterium]|mgnify:CR=1 FL=1|jgi:cell division protein FtsA|nr:cell division protein FtsA [Rhodospirillales bacterium]MBT4040371.1 cell division protein FtsA [Rhodospirillales bacterium]MBT4625999.1 cell division protein FtsA [Rhodospirillales bacterium]MBT5351275.1 cell division protein FtsA [Rhodospirillales bacterium]MBT6110467.1 cell division protein FtsA [Rhodospirillales bacterium]
MKKNNTQQHNRNALIAALDVGTTKVCCLIARMGEFGPKIVGIGHQVSAGVRNGTIVDMDALEGAIRATVETAEQMAESNVQEVMINLSSNTIASRLIAYEVATAGHRIDDADLRRLLDPQVLQIDEGEGRERVHTIPVGYSIDGTRGIRDPIGMYGDRLGVNMHVVSASSPVLRNLETTVTRCHLGVSGVAVSSYASALSCLVGDEAKLGVTMIDMGGGTTSVAVYFDGELVHTDVVPLGGSHITNDIARGLSTPLGHAERVKNLFGNAVPSSTDDRAVIEVPLIGEDGTSGASQVPRSMLVGIIRPRVEEIFELIRDRLAKAGFEQVSGPRVVLTGGASQLPGVTDVASEILDRQVRIGKPAPMDGLAEAVSGPAFSTCTGLIHYAVNSSQESAAGAFHPTGDSNATFGKLGQWFRENF